MTSRYAFASVHGRFQPLHNGHMEYLLTAKDRCEFLWIGIAAPDPIEIRRYRDTDREKQENNPLSYFERLTIITGALIDSRVPQSNFGFVPFPIEVPERLPNYLPTSIPCLTTICEPWNREKIATLSRMGYTVEVLYERTTKTVSGAEIRTDLVQGRERWMTLVPQATIRGVKDYDLAARLKSLRGA